MTDRHTVLLTGATGAIGPAIAADLLVSAGVERINVLIRPSSVGLAARFDELLAAVASEMDERSHALFDWRQRIAPIAGDLCRDGLGLDRFTFQALRRTTTAIVHAAADTQFVAPLTEQANVNVAGVERVLQFARACHSMPRVLLLSTICVAGRTEGRIYERPLNLAPDFINSYEQTKWQAEQLALASDVPLGIARVGVVLGSNATGLVHRPGALHHLMRWLGRGLVPALPGNSRSRLDAISSEQVGAFVAAAVQQDWPDKSIWHVAAGDAAAHVSEFCEIIYSELFPGEPVHNVQQPGEPFLVDQARFDAIRLSKTDRRQRLTRGALDAISSFVPMLPLDRVFDTRAADALLGCAVPPDDWRDTLTRVLRRSHVRARRAVA